MEISITGPAEIRFKGFRDTATSQLTRVLARFSSNISRIDAVLTDENGPRGVVEKRCRIFVRMTGCEPIVSEATDENPVAAVVRAAARARQLVMARLNRPPSLPDRIPRNGYKHNTYREL